MNTETTQTMADKLNSVLHGDGVVQVTTYLKSTLYTKKHAGMFSMRGDSLYVQHGKSINRLSHGKQMLVGVRTGRLA